METLKDIFNNFNESMDSFRCAGKPYVFTTGNKIIYEAALKYYEGSGIEVILLKPLLYLSRKKKTKKWGRNYD